MHSDKPRLTIPLSPSDKTVEFIGWFLLILLWTMAIRAYASLPDTIPVHFDASGRVDHYGPRTGIFWLPALGTLLAGGLSLLNRFPHLFNYPVKIMPENALRHYTAATRMVRYLKCALNLVFLIIVGVISNPGGQSESAGVWLLPLILGIVFIPLGYYIYQAVYRNR